MSFETGVVIFFRQMVPPDQLARSVHPTGRDIEVSRESGDYLVLDEDRGLLGIYPKDYVAAILPLLTTGPGADASDQQTRYNNPSAPTQGNSKGYTR